MHFRVASLDELTAREWHAVLRLRAQVFVVEQACIFCDPDDLDAEAEHVLVHEPAGHLAAYARLHETPAGVRISRVVTAPRARGGGLGHRLLRRCLEHVGDRPAWLHAQDHLRGYYAAHGFAARGAVFMEDGIPHVRMERPAPAR